MSWPQIIGAVVSMVVNAIVNKPEDVVQTGPRLEDLTIQTSTYGVSLPIVYGTVRIAGNVIWSTNKIETKTVKKSGGKGGGPKVTQTTYTYAASFAIALCEGEITGIRRIWNHGKLVYDISETNTESTGLLNDKFVTYKGTQTQLPDPTIESIEGVGKTPAYRGMAYVVFNNLELAEFGNTLPNLTFEVIRSPLSNIVKPNGYAEITETLAQSDIKGIAYSDYNNCVYSLASYSINSNTYVSLYKLNTDDTILKGPSISDSLVGHGISSLLNFTEEKDYHINILFNGDVAIICYSADGGNGRIANHLLIYDANTLALKSYSSTKTNAFYIDGSVVNRDINAEVLGGKLVLNNYDYDGIKDVSYYSVGTFNVGADTEYYKTDKYAITFNRYNIDLIENFEVGGMTLVYSTKGLLTKNCYDIDPKTGIIYYIERDWTSDRDTFSGAYLSAFKTVGINLEAQKRFHTISNIEGDGATDLYFDEVTRCVFVLYRKSTGISRLSYTYYLYKYNVDTNTMIFNIFLNMSTNKDDLNNTKISINKNKREMFYISNNVANTMSYISLDTGNIRSEIYGNIAALANGFNFTKYSGTYDYLRDRYIFIGDNSLYKNAYIWMYGDRMTDGGYWLDAIVNDLSTRTGIKAIKTDVTQLQNILVDGYVVSTRTAIRSCLEQLSTGFLFDGIESEYKLKFILRGKNSVKIIDYKEFGAMDYSNNLNFSELLTMTRQQELELPKKINLIYIDKNKDYQPNTEESKRQLNTTEEVQSISLPIVFNNNKAKQLVDKLMYNAWVSRDSFTFTTNYDHIDLEPSDVITVNKEDATYNLRIVKKEEDLGKIKFQVVSEDATVYSQDSTGASILNNKQTISITTNSSSIFLDIPILLDSNNDVGCYIATKKNNNNLDWTGSVLYSSNTEFGEYDEVTDFNIEAINGYLLNKLGNFTDNNTVDFYNKITVKVNGGILTSITEEEFLSGVNTAIIGNEIITFKNAVLTDINTYELSWLLRGRYGTDKYINNHFSTYENFVKLDNSGSIQRILSDINIIKTQKFYKNVSYGKYLADVKAVRFVNNGIGLKSYAVYNVIGSRDSSANLNITWNKRIRGDAHIRDGVTNVDPDGDNYEIDVIKNGLVIRTIIVTDLTSAIYTSANQVTDFGSNQSSVQIIIYKMNSIIGRGFEKTKYI